MDWKNQLTRTPVLIFFVLLGGIGVGTASALITITLAGDVVITDNLIVEGETLIKDKLTVLGSTTPVFSVSENLFGVIGPIHISPGGSWPGGLYNTMGNTAFSNHGLNDASDLVVGDMLEVHGKIFADDGCEGCAKTYQLTHPSPGSGFNDLSCNSGDIVINGGGWSTSLTHSIRESWALDNDTWRLGMIDNSGNSVAPGAFKITCLDYTPFHTP